MTVSLNGTFRIPKLVVETRPVEINGKEYPAYFQGGRMPRPVLVMLTEAAYHARKAVELEPGNPAPPLEAMSVMLRALIPDLPQAEADLLSPDELQALVAYLGFVTDAETAAGAGD